MLQTESALLAIVVDQLEELFATGEITADDRIAFIRCRDGLAKSFRVLMIGTMRSDYGDRILLHTCRSYRTEKGKMSPRLLRLDADSDHFGWIVWRLAKLAAACAYRTFRVFG
jgi:hypothetical protein